MNTTTTTPDPRTKHPSAFRRGHEYAAIAAGDSTRLHNPYPARSERWYAFAAGWDAWVLQVLAQRKETA